MHPIIYPNVLIAIQSELRDYIINVCATLIKQKTGVSFAFIIADLQNPHVNKRIFKRS
jgi:hypothetical protein